MHWLMILLIGIAASIDNFAVGMSFGIKGKKITWQANLFMAAVALAASLIMLIAGSVVGFKISDFYANLTSGSMILGIGIWSLFSAIKNRNTLSKTFPQAEQIDRDQNNLISFNETFWLSFALSFNAMGTAFGAGLGRLNPIGVAFTVSFLSFFSIDAGQRVGLTKIRSRIGALSEYIASLLLICIGIYTLFVSV
ncbi:manganese efflux pump [Sporolactobacillus sp. CPB3-1]|uniref:Manganese efflux pump n=1 Tax=Sporolactobacillus mangiferae TaxID=2940498 RepID=A0ABT0M8G7_9BACL|nr:manganese efflux pump [Sporolactobacillus mangiferae]MCL1631156.1 manganese efflux pump [Sporolactobacillus mangiferae]